MSEASHKLCLRARFFPDSHLVRTIEQFRQRYQTEMAAPQFEEEVEIKLTKSLSYSRHELKYLKQDLQDSADDFHLESFDLKLDGLDLERKKGKNLLTLSAALSENSGFCFESLSDLCYQRRQHKEEARESLELSLIIGFLNNDAHQQSILDNAARFFVLPIETQLAEIYLAEFQSGHGWKNIAQIIRFQQ